MLPKFLPLVVIAASPLSSHGAVTSLNYYRLGDADPGAVAGALVNSATIDSAGSRNLKHNGSPLYSGDVAFPAIAGATNGYSVEFSGDAFADFSSGTRLTDATDNFGFELFVKVHSTTSNAGIAYNGKKSTTGFGLLQSGTQFRAMLAADGPWTGGGMIDWDSPIALNQWYHLALVRDQGLATFYVNGVAVGTSTFAPDAASAPFRIGSSVGSDALDGLIDEVRLFTFQPGQFSTKDLHINQVPEPATAGMLAVGLTTLLTRKRRRIQPRNPMQFPQGSRT